MKTEVIQISETAREFRVEIEPERIKEVYRNISRRFAKSVSIPGFRKGFAPEELVRIHYKDEIKERVLDDLIRNDLAEALEKSELRPISEPKISIENYPDLKLDGTEKAIFKLFFEVMPEVPTPDSSDLELVRRVRPVTEESVKAAIDLRREKEAVFVPIEGRKSQEGDTVIVDLDGVFIDGSTNDKIQLEDVEIVLGDESIEKAFSENLIGVEEDDVRKFVVEYPENYPSADLASKKVEYTAKVKSVGRVELPEPTDEWAKEHGFESLEQMRQKIAEDLRKSAEIFADASLREELLEKLAAKYSFEVPSVLISAQARELFSEVLEDARRRGVQLENIDRQYLQQIYSSLLPKAEKQIRKALLLGKLIEVEDFEVSEQDLDKEINKIAEQSRLSSEEVRKWLNQENRIERLKDGLKEQKAIDFLLNKAKISEGEWGENRIEDSNEQADLSESETPQQEETK